MPRSLARRTCAPSRLQPPLRAHPLAPAFALTRALSTACRQLSANTQVKTIEGHYTGHFKAVVTKPQNVMIMRDIACAGYVAGGNCRWFAETKDDAGNKVFTSDQAQSAIQDRLSFADDTTDRYASMLAFPAYEGQFTGGQLDTVMSVTGRLLPWEVNGASTLTHDSFPGGEQMYAAYSGLLNLRSVHYGEVRVRARVCQQTAQPSTHLPSCACAGHEGS